VEFGANVTVSDAFCPGSSVNGTAGALTLKPVPAAEIWVTIPPALPAAAELVTVTVLDLRLPTDTLPKFRLAGFTVRFAAAG